jgi:hypothetical protein
MQSLIEALAATAEIMQAEVSPVGLVVMAEDLQAYDQNLVMQAISRFRKESSKFSLNGIIQQIEKINPNRRISADEAWAIYPHDEATSAVITNEMAEAMQVAYPLLQEGDKVGARMAFKNSYERITENNKANGLEPKWFPSLGSDPSGRELVITEAVRLGRLPQSTIQTLLPPPLDHKFTSNVIALKQVMQIADKQTPQDIEKNKARIADIKSMLAKG